MVRHAEPANPESNELIRSDSLLLDLQGKRAKSGIGFEHHSTYTGILLPQIWKPSAAELAARAEAFIQIVAEYFPPPDHPTCENTQCLQPAPKDGRLVLLGGLPVFLCETCITTIPEKARQAEREYEQATQYNHTAVLAGSGVALLVALAWVVMGSISPSFQIFPLMLLSHAVFQAMKKAGMRLTWLSLAIVFLLTLVGTTLGSLGVSLAGLLRDGSQLSALTLVQAWADFITDTQILRFVYGFSLIWWLIVMAIAGYEQNRAKQLFRPDLEVPPDGI